MKVDFGEWMPDRAELGNPGLVEAKNTIAAQGCYTEFLGLSEVSNAVGEAPLGAISTSVINSTSETFAGGASKLWRLTGNTWGDASATSSLATSTGWEFAQFGNNVLAASYENQLQFSEIGSGDDFALAHADAPKARRIGTVRNFVFVGDIYDPTDGPVPWRVRWCGLDNALNWPLAGTNSAYAAQSDEQDLHAEDGAVQAIVGTEYALIFQEKAITRGDYVGSPLVFQFSRIDSTRGAISPGSVVNVGSVCYFLSRDGFYANNGAGDSVSIGYGKVDKWVLDQLDDNTITKIRGASDPRRKIVFWAFPANGSETLNRVIIFNYAEQRWTWSELDLAGVLYARQAGYALEDLDAFSSSLDDLAIPLDDPFWGPGGQFLAAFTSDYKLATFNGDALDATFETGEFGMEGERGFCNGLRPLVVGSEATVTVEFGTRNRLSDAVTYTAPRSVTSATGRADFRHSAFYFRARINISGGFDKALGADALMVADDAAR